jgi:glycosyltransferase involved in cell wall biosynthesis
VLTRRWVVLREGERRRWGGDLRRRYLFDGLVEQTGAIVVDDWKASSMARALMAIGGRRREVWRRSAFVASSELLADPQLDAVVRHGIAQALDIHDQPLAQDRALGIATPPDVEARLGHLLERNLAAFRWHIAQSASFMRLAGLDPSRTIIASNGCDPRHVVPHPMPDAPIVGFVSGAAPGRGIEDLIEASRLARTEIPDLELRLWLVATGDGSQRYLETLIASVAGDSWIVVAPAPYETLGTALGSAAILVVPHPPNPYMDVVLPIKLFDSMAAGRPVVVTPRTEMAAVVERHQAGVVARGDTVADLAEPIVRLARDRALRERLGANARMAAEREFDWKVIGARLADTLVARSRPWYQRAGRLADAT